MNEFCLFLIKNLWHILKFNKRKYESVEARKCSLDENASHDRKFYLRKKKKTVENLLMIGAIFSENYLWNKKLSKTQDKHF